MCRPGGMVRRTAVPLIIRGKVHGVGAHARPIRDGADLSPAGPAWLIRDVLDLRDVTLVGSDTCGALVQPVIARGAEREGAAVPASCDAYDNFRPGLTGTARHAAGVRPPAGGRTPEGATRRRTGQVTASAATGPPPSASRRDGIVREVIRRQPATRS